MIDFKTIDSCRTMESFKSARSYNDLVVVLSTINGNTESIANRVQKGASAPVLLQGVESLEEFSYSLQFSKTLSVITTDNKTAKYKLLCSKVENLVNTTLSNAYHALNTLGMQVESEQLQELAFTALNFLSKYVKVYASIIIPINGNNVTHYFILNNISTPSGYIISEFIIALNSTKLNNTESLTISFPSKMFFPADAQPVSKKTVTKAIESCIGSDVLAIQRLKPESKNAINRIDNVSATYIDDNHLAIELSSDVSPSDINNVLTKILPIAYVALGITDPRKDIIHRMSVAPNGNKVIKIALMDRNFCDSSAIRTLKRRLNLDSQTYKTLLSITGQ